MRRLVVVLILLVVCGIALGYYRNWFTISTASDDNAVDVHVTVDKDKLNADEKTAKEKLGQVRERITEKAGEAASKGKKGSGGENPGDKQP